MLRNIISYIIPRFTTEDIILDVEKSSDQDADLLAWAVSRFCKRKENKKHKLTTDFVIDTIFKDKPRYIKICSIGLFVWGSIAIPCGAPNAFETAKKRTVNE